MTDYVPTTEEVRNGYVGAESEPNPYVSEDERVEFDRWLAEVKAEAWQDGAYHIAGSDNELVAKADNENPYREENNV